MARFRGPRIVSLGATLLVALAGTPPWRLTYEIQPLGPNALHHSDFPATFVPTQFSIDVAEPSPFLLPAAATGLYHLVDVADVTTQAGLVGNETIAVVIGPVVLPARPERPPTAKFTTHAPVDVCTGSYVSAGLRLAGVPPFVLVVDRRHNAGAALRVTLPARERGNSTERDYTIDLGGVEAEGQFSWTVVSVTDARNLSTVYERGFADQKAASTANSKTPNGSGAAPVFVINARARPTVSFGSERVLLSTVRREAASVVITGRAPWTVHLVHTAANASDAGVVASNVNIAVASKAAVDLAGPGEYRLVNVADAFCTGEVLEPSVLRAELAPLPTVAWDPSSAPTAACLGAMLVTIPLTLTGRGPWLLTYKETVTDDAGQVRADKLNVTIASASYGLRLVPLATGHRRYELVAVSDYNHENVPLEAMAYELDVRRRPTVTFTESKPLRSCMTGEPTVLPITVTGQAPLKLTYAVQLGDEQRAFLRLPDGHATMLLQLDAVAAGSSALTVEGLTVRGRYRVVVRQVTDALGCTSDQPNERIVVVDRVTASLGCEDGPGGAPMRAGEGARLNVAIAGGVPPYTVEYRTPAQATAAAEVVARLPYGVPLTVSGLYTLLSVRDAQCVGVIEKPDACAVDVVARPTVSITAGASEVCLGQSVELAAMNFTGTSPWRIGYTVGSAPTAPTAAGISSSWFAPSPIVDLAVHHVDYTTATDARFVVRPTEIGDVVYQWTNLTDRHYDHVALTPPATFRFPLRVIPTPSAAWRHGDDLVATAACVGRPVQLPVVLRGEPPFVLRYTVKEVTDGIASQQGTEHTVKLDRETPTSLADQLSATWNTWRTGDSGRVTWERSVALPPFTGAGLFQVSLLSVGDLHGCETRLDHQSALNLEIGLPAHVDATSPHVHRCVKSPMRFHVGPAEGGPWLISYTFNGEELTRNATSESLTIEANVPGELRVHTVTNKFCSVAVDIARTVHARPTAVFDGGVEEDAYLGEGQVAELEVQLTGEPPFNVTIERLSFMDDTPELYELLSLRGHTHIFTAQKEGEYKVIYVADQHCVARPSKQPASTPRPLAAGREGVPRSALRPGVRAT